MIKQDVIPVPVPKPNVPTEEETLDGGELVADWISAHPRPVAALVLTAVTIMLWRIPKVRGVMLLVLGIFLGIWLVGEGLT